jgi:hypothetical protein
MGTREKGREAVVKGREPRSARGKGRSPSKLGDCVRASSGTSGLNRMRLGADEEEEGLPRSESLITPRARSGLSHTEQMPPPTATNRVDLIESRSHASPPPDSATTANPHFFFSHYTTIWWWD